MSHAIRRLASGWPCLALILLGLTGCATVDLSASPSDRRGGATNALAAVAGPATERVVVTGRLAYRERIALPSATVAIVTLRASASPDAPVLFEQRFPMAGGQVPVNFVLEVPPERLPVGRPVWLHGGLEVSGRTEWAAPPVAVPASREPHDVGELVMVRRGG